jgi:hypothetical protein
LPAEIVPAALSDVDGEGDLDGFVANDGAKHTFVFSYGARPLTDADSRRVALGDIAGDGKLGAIAANRATVNVLWLNRRVDYAVLPIIIAR